MLGQYMKAAVTEVCSQQAYAEGAAAFRANESFEIGPYPRSTVAGEERVSGIEDTANALSPAQEEWVCLTLKRVAIIFGNCLLW